MLGRRATQDMAPPPLPPASAPASDESAAIETLASILRTLGELAFDIAETPEREVRQQFERWARHILLGLAVSDDEPPATVGAMVRDWPALRRFVNQHRRRERDHVVRGFSDMRQVIWAFVHSLGKAVPEEHGEEERTRQQLARLRAAAALESLEGLKREAMATVALIDEVSERRLKRQTSRTQELSAQVKMLGARLEVAERENVTDSLTNLANRRAFDQELTRMAHMAAVFGEECCLLLIDADHFKDVNDRYGHRAGDAVLRALADVLVRTFPRRSDTVARFGGEEFAILLRDANGRDALRLGERLREAVRNLKVHHEGQDIQITVSVGISAAAPAQPAEWLDRADRALYAAKREGRNRCVVADGSLAARPQASR
jgi:diguanylate cyclase